MVVLDTHAWLWWAAGDPRLSETAQSKIDQADLIGISSLSVFELARLAASGRLIFDNVERWLASALRFDDRIVELSVDQSISLGAVDALRRGLTGDPIDQLIFATAEQNSAMLVTRDRKLRAFAPTQTIW